MDVASHIIINNIQLILVISVERNELLAISIISCKPFAIIDGGLRDKRACFVVESSGSLARKKQDDSASQGTALAEARRHSCMFFG